MDAQAVENFREYLRINTAQPTPDYDGAHQFQRRMAEELGLPYQIVEVAPGKQVGIMTWKGTKPELKSIVLNSHMDVVPVYPESWKHDPFAAIKDEAGDIYARGTQDMKCCGIWYLEAIRRLKKQNVQLARTIHVIFVPDEEIGGFLGMKLFVETEEFKSLNMGFGLDEGLASPTNAFKAFYGERSVYWIKVVCHGNPGHGSRFIKDSAGQKMRKVINYFMDFRDQQEKRLESDPSLNLGDVITTNLTMMEGGVQPNVVPQELSVTFDMRVTPTMDLQEMDAKIKNWCSDDGVEVVFIQKGPFVGVTSTDMTDPWWKTFKTSCDQMDMKLEVEIFPAGTDCRFMREKGFPAIGFSPMNNTTVLMHDHNEYLNEKIFINGINIYEKLITDLGNVSDTA